MNVFHRISWFNRKLMKTAPYATLRLINSTVKTTTKNNSNTSYAIGTSPLACPVAQRNPDHNFLGDSNTCIPEKSSSSPSSSPSLRFESLVVVTPSRTSSSS